MKESRKWSLRALYVYGLLELAGCGVNYVSQLKSDYFNKETAVKSTHQEIEQILNEEKRKLGLENRNVKIGFFSKSRTFPHPICYVLGRLEDSTPEKDSITISKDKDLRTILQHELYHLKDRAENAGFLKRWWQDERANLYVLTGLKL